MPDPTVKTMDVTPIFNYTRSVEIVKRFTEQLTRLNEGIEGPKQFGMDIDGYIGANLDHVRRAVSEIMADDVKQQIGDKVFPIRFPAIAFHEFEPYDGDPSGKACQECDGQREAIAHTL